MARKTKTRQALVESQVETQVPLVESQEVEDNQVEETPASVGEKTQEEVFAGQEDRPDESEEAQLPEDPSIAQSEVSAQSKTTSAHSYVEPVQKPPRINRRPYVEFVKQMLEKGVCDRRALVEAVLREFPTVTKGSISTFLTDAKNPKYSFFKDREVTTHPKTGNLIFADAVEEVSPHEESEMEPQEQPEQPEE